MRVLQLVPTLDVGGAERMAARLCLEERRLGADVAMVALGPDQGGFILGELRAAGVEVVCLDKGPGLEPGVVARLQRELRRWRPDVVHTHLHVLKYLLPALVGLPRTRVVHTLHNVAEHEVERHTRPVHALAFRLGVVPVAIGGAVAESVARVYGRTPLFVVPNGIDLDPWTRPTPPASRGALGVPEGVPLFLTAGRLNAQKNQALLLEAFAAPALAATGAQLLVAGGGELADALARRAEAPDLRGRVHLLGVRDDLPALLAAVDAFVLSSSWEGNPLVVMEAMAAGRAVVSTAVGCVPELVGPETGLLVVPGEAPALSAALLALAGNRAHAAALGAAGRTHALAHFGADRMAAAYLGIYAQAHGLPKLRHPGVFVR